MTQRLWRYLMVAASAAFVVGLSLMTSMGVPPTLH